MNMKHLKWTLFFVLLSFGMQSFAQPLWMRYPAISPDGSQIVFSYKGNLYKVSSVGGTAIPLTMHSAHDYQPVWSPDGKSIAFASNRFGNFDVYLIPAEGGEAQRLTYHSANEHPQTFTPDGKSILFSAQILDDVKSSQFPYARMPEMYQVNIENQEVTQYLTTPAENMQFSKKGDFVLFHDYKGYEDPWRKHHTSSVTRDVWKYTPKDGEFTQLSSFQGEDRNPVLASNQQTVFYLSEQFGNFNVCSFNLDAPEKVEPISSFEHHPVRFLSMADNDVLCYGYDGEIYTQIPGEEPQKVAIKIAVEKYDTDLDYNKLSSGANEMAVSPDGKEIAFIIRGEVFVTSADYGTTKRITNTPEQERSVSFSPNGRSLLYASERNGSWNLYQSSLVKEDELNFSSSSLIEEEPILEVGAETFQPSYSPDGKKIAFLENRVTLRVMNLKNKEIHTVLDSTYNFSYADGDQWYQWAPDSKWLAVQYCPYPTHWSLDDVGLVAADGSGEVKNLTNSGYVDFHPQWMMNGNAIIWFSDKLGMRNHGSWGSQDDVYVMFLNQESLDQFKLTKEELELKKELAKNDKKKGSKKDKNTKEIHIEWKKLEDRIERLTVNSSNLAGALLSPSGDKLYYLSKFEGGHDLWLHDFRKNETKKIADLNGSGGAMQADSAFNNIYFTSGGKIMKMSTRDNRPKSVSYKAEMYLDTYGERAAMFEHAWRQVKRKWYDPALHQVDWDYYKAEYERYLPHINNNFDFSEMMSEMLGEMNGSHTGCRYSPKSSDGDATATLGLFYDNTYEGKGLKIAEVMDKSPVISEDSKIAAGLIIEQIDGIEVNNANKYKLMNHKAGKITLLSLYNPKNGKRWDEKVKPISKGVENKLLYERWVKQKREETERLSDGKIGYVHVKGMNSASYREFYSDVLGRNFEKKALIVDTRFNGGGWLHDDLVTFLSGKKYADYYPGGRYFGSEPIYKWSKPSCVLMSEGNYSDAHGFPFAYNALGIGKLIGMPVPGTMTAVWWERLVDPTLVFGIPQVGVKNMNGEYLENNQLEPDIKVQNTYIKVMEGIDEQLEAAVKEMLLETAN